MRIKAFVPLLNPSTLVNCNTNYLLGGGCLSGKIGDFLGGKIWIEKMDGLTLLNINNLTICRGLKAVSAHSSNFLFASMIGSRPMSKYDFETNKLLLNHRFLWY